MLGLLIPSYLIGLIRPIRLFLVLLLLVASSALGEESLNKVGTAGGRPDDAIIIFDGTNTTMLAGPNGGPFNWALEDGTIIVKPGEQQRQQGLWTRLHFRDAQIHVEFSFPKSAVEGVSAANSGLYLHGLFELQIVDSFNNAMEPMNSTGSLYNFRPPLVDATRDVDTWQTYDVIFIAPRRDEAGKPVKPGSITVLLNGVLVQHNTPFLEHQSIYTPLHFRTTPYAERIRDSLMKTECGPMQLQDHDHPVRFRNIWIRPLDDKAFVLETE
ncbi:MAG: DUF1080 domain-containing protein [Candidatus Hydrogenedentes bacterium]|nr:DUF1080 domain-containing protein [Candidatus Hydrogenedentota bacterium]